MTQDLARDDGGFGRFCVVGLGNHARTKLIPALVANGQQIAGLVTRRHDGDLPGTPVFAQIGEALAALPPDTVFVIATPPALHFDQAAAVIKAGRDLIIEKPAFVTKRNAIEALDEAKRQGTVVVEAFMHRHTQLYRRLMEFWPAERKVIDAIDVDFLIPSLPPGNFRQGDAIECSGLYDIGCYALSLLTDLNLPLQALDVTDVDCPGQFDKEAVELEGLLAGTRAKVRIGVSEAYVNRVSFRNRDGQTTEFSPFFYGRSGEKVISHGAMPVTRQEIIRDKNAFEEMFAVPRRVWFDSQSERAQPMIEVTANLERLGRALTMRRKKALVS